MQNAQRLNTGDIVTMAEPRIVMVCFMMWCVCVCYVLVIEKIGAILIEFADVLNVCFITLFDFFGRGDKDFIQAKVSTDKLSIQADEILAFDWPTASSQAICFKDSVCLAFKPSFESVKDSVVRERPKGDSGGE